MIRLKNRNDQCWEVDCAGGNPCGTKKSIREVLGEALNIEVSFTSDFTRSKFDSQKRLAADHLIDLGVLQVSGPDYRTTDMLRVTAILLQAAGRGWFLQPIQRQ